MERVKLPKVLQSMGVEQTDLLKTDVCLYAADRRKLSILGVLPVVVTSRKAVTGELVEIRGLLYIVDELGKLYVSREALMALGSIPGCFPEVPGLWLSTEISSTRFSVHAMSSYGGEYWEVEGFLDLQL